MIRHSLLLLLFQSLFALQVSSDKLEKVDQTILSGIHAFHESEYQKSLDYFQKVQLALPEHPAGYFYRAAVLKWMGTDHRSTKFYNEFDKEISKAISKAKALKKAQPENPWAYFYLGGAIGFRGLQHTDMGRFIKGYNDGTTGVRQLFKAVELKPDLYDAYYGIGLFHYWVGFFSDFLAWLPGLGGNKQQGIEELEKSYANGKYTRMEAICSRLRIHTTEKEYKKAIALANELIEKNPDYIYLHWYRAATYESMGEWSLAQKDYSWLFKYIQDNDLKNPNFMMDVHSHLARAYWGMNDREMAENHLQKARINLKKSDKREPLYEGTKGDIKKLGAELGS